MIGINGFELNNLIGQILVNESAASKSITLDFSHFSSGIYFVNFIKDTGRNIQSFKVINQ